MTIDINLIVPFRRHSLKECDDIICSACKIGVAPDANLVRQLAASISLIHVGWIEACLTENKKRLTDWEQNFLISIQDQLTMRGSLNEKQVAILERIYTEKT